MPELQVAVIGDSHIDKRKDEFCVQLGKMLAELKFTVITGGKSGVMKAVSKGASESGGLTVGILPSHNKQEANPYCRVIIPTGLGHARNSLTVLAADAVIVIGGKAGTLTEIGFAWIHNKPIFAVTVFGGFAKKYADQKLDDRRDNKITGISSLDEMRIHLIRIASQNQ